MKKIIEKLREIMAEAEDVQVMEIIYPYIPQMLLSLEKLASERKVTAHVSAANEQELPLTDALPAAGATRRSGRRVDFYRNGELVQHCRSIAEATECLCRAGHATSRAWVGVQLTGNGRLSLGEYELVEVAR